MRPIKELWLPDDDMLFIDRTMIVGLSIAALGLILSAVVFWIAINNLSTPRIVRLVTLIPSRGNVILDDVGDSYSLSVRGYYSDQTIEDLDPEYVTYRSTDTEIVGVSQDGVVTANGPGSADIIIEYGPLSKSLHALVFGDIPTLPPIDPAMVGIIPGLDVEVRAVLNRSYRRTESGA